MFLHSSTRLFVFVCSPHSLHKIFSGGFSLAINHCLQGLSSSPRGVSVNGRAPLDVDLLASRFSVKLDCFFFRTRDPWSFAVDVQVTPLPIYAFLMLQLLPKVLHRKCKEFLWFWLPRPDPGECGWRITLGTSLPFVARSGLPFFSTVLALTAFLLKPASWETGESLIWSFLPYWKLRRWLLGRFTIEPEYLILLGVRLWDFILACRL